MKLQVAVGVGRKRESFGETFAKSHPCLEPQRCSVKLLPGGLKSISLYWFSFNCCRLSPPSSSSYFWVLGPCGNFPFDISFTAFFFFFPLNWHGLLFGTNRCRSPSLHLAQAQAQPKISDRIGSLLLKFLGPTQHLFNF